MKAVIVLLALVCLVAAEFSTVSVPVRHSLKRKAHGAPKDACNPDPCQEGETCCLMPGDQAGCCPLANACCCPDQAHCCENPYKCVCSGTCPGPNCQCLSCTSTGGACENSAVQF